MLLCTACSCAHDHCCPVWASYLQAACAYALWELYQHSLNQRQCCLQVATLHKRHTDLLMKQPHCKGRREPRNSAMSKTGFAFHPRQFLPKYYVAAGWLNCYCLQLYSNLPSSGAGGFMLIHRQGCGAAAAAAMSSGQQLTLFFC